MERRFEIRADSSAIEGVAIRYGDHADLPWGMETFRAGAFGNVAEIDALLSFQHDRARPLARTRGGGLVFTDSPSELSFRAELPNTSEASDTLELVRAGVLRGASIEFYPTEERVSKDANGKTVTEIISARLSGLAIVDKPAYPESVIAARERALAERAGEGSAARASRAHTAKFDGRRVFI